MPTTELTHLQAGTIIPFGGNRAAIVPEHLAIRFRPGDHLIVLQDTGDLLLVPAEQKALAAHAVGLAHAAFTSLQTVPDAAITRFFAFFADRLENDATWATIARANEADVARSLAAGRSTTRLAATPAMRRDMVAGLRAWRDAPSSRGRILERIEHQGWSLEKVAAPLGVVGFVFEGRPNVFADAAGVLRTGNTVVFRIGSDALGTAQAIVAHALMPALAEAGLPEGAVSLVDSAERAAGWALFADSRLSLAVARGSGPAVAQLGSVARQAGTAVSLHGTGGAWMVGDHDADVDRFAAVVRHSLDRKVCNTLNVCCIHRDRAADLVPAFLAALREAGANRGAGYKLHILAGGEHHLPERAEPKAETLDEERLGHEWEWENTPEVTLAIVDDLDQAIALFNRYSPHFIASLIAEDPAAHRHFFDRIDAPFVGDGFTRWVDGQYALNQPELGLSNWENARLLARGAILSGSGVFTVRARVVQTDATIRR